MCILMRALQDYALSEYSLDMIHMSCLQNTSHFISKYIPTKCRFWVPNKCNACAQATIFPHGKNGEPQPTHHQPPSYILPRHLTLHTLVFITPGVTLQMKACKFRYFPCIMMPGKYQICWSTNQVNHNDYNKLTRRV